MKKKGHRHSWRYTDAFSRYCKNCNQKEILKMIITRKDGKKYPSCDAILATSCKSKRKTKPEYISRGSEIHNFIKRGAK